MLDCAKDATMVDEDSVLVEDAGADGSPGAREDVGATPRLRMIGDVLVEPRHRDAPTKRRRGRARRSTCTKIQGTLKDYFCNIPVPKEISLGNSTVEGAQMRKRKGEDLVVKDPKRRTGSVVQLCLMIDDDEETCSLADSIWGAKSKIGRETDEEQTEATGNGLDLTSLAPMRTKLAGDWTTDDSRRI